MSFLKKNLIINFIVRIVKIVDADLGYFFKNGFWVSLRYFFILATGLVLSVAFARLVSKEFLGQYQSVIAFFGILSFFSLPGLNIAALKSVALGDHHSVIRAVKWSFYSSLIGLPFVIGYAAYSYSISNDPQFPLAILLAGLFFPFYNAVNTWYAYYEGQGVFKPVTLRVILTNFLLVVSIVVSLLLNANLLLVLTLYFGISTVLNSIFFLEIKRKLKNVPPEGGNSLDWRLGIDISFQKLAYSILDNLPILSASFLLGFEKLAIFQIAYYFLISTSGFFGGLSSIYLPLLFLHRKINYHQAILKNLVIGGVSFGVFLLLANLIFIPLFGIKYAASLALVKTMSPIVVIFPLKIFLFNFLTSRNRNWYVTGSVLTASIISLVVFMLGRDVIEYLYTLNVILLVFLLVGYFLVVRNSSNERSYPV